MSIERETRRSAFGAKAARDEEAEADEVRLSSLRPGAALCCRSDNLDRRVCDRARRSRDARFDGRFFIGVTSTRIYCRPICPARVPKDESIRYLPTAAAA